MKPGRARDKLTVGDFFCGAGGFSEGFRQAGFDVSWGVDNWDPAVRTFGKNFPQAESLKCDVDNLDPENLERVDVVIGSPPCTHFSTANRGGNGDKRLGFQLVRRYFELVMALRPKYWVMENVPPLNRTLETELQDDSIHLRKGVLAVPRRSVLVASSYGTPQDRRRLFSGNYPVPEQGASPASRPLLTLGNVLSVFPDPCEGMPSASRTYMDPLYADITRPETELRDHFEDTKFRISADDLEHSRLQKEEHPWGGRMDWPDRLDRPSRTITATRTTSSRSTIVIDCPHHSDGLRHYRGLTLRECASVQGFPTTYQFWADSLAAKEALVGNAVAPPVARSIAHAILRELQVRTSAAPIVSPATELPPILAASRGGSHRYSAVRRFRGVVPVERKPECRVQLENDVSSDFRAGRPFGVPQVTWAARLYLGYAKEYRCYDVAHSDALRIIAGASSQKWVLVPIGDTFSELMHDAESSFLPLPDASSLQMRWAGRLQGGVSPQDVLTLVREVVDANFPPKAWKGKLIPKRSYASILASRVHSRGRDADAKPPIDIPVRTLAALAALSLACKIVNSGAAKHRDPALPDGPTSRRNHASSLKLKDKGEPSSR